MTLTFRPRTDITSWGRVIRREQRAADADFVSTLIAWGAEDKGPRLAVGLRRSYGETGLSSSGRLILTPALNRFRAFDAASGLVKAEAGLSLGELLTVAVPKGWFVPVTPGTKRITLGGAVANDVHGKNHTRGGTFGRHVRALTLLRSDRGVVEVTPETEPDLFAATIGGMGLTGVILDVTLQLAPIPSAYLDVETFPMRDLSDFFAFNADSLDGFEQTVAWVDCTEGGARLGVGYYTRANWSSQGGYGVHSAAAKTVPFEAPGAVLNPLSLTAFNRAVRIRQRLKRQKTHDHYGPFLYPLDGVQEWNRLYGAAGFYQYQCVTPIEAGPEAVRALLEVVAKSGEGSPLVVLKTFGALPSPGWMSFPRAGYTLALDFRNRGAKTLALMERMDAIVREARGALYPAKDGRMGRAMFELSFDKLPAFLNARDPACGSDFFERLGF